MTWANLESPGARWLLYAAATTLVGTAGAHRVLAPFIASSATPSVLRRLLLVRRPAAALLVVATLLILVAQIRAWFGVGETFAWEHYSSTITRTTWGTDWVELAGLSLALLVATLLPVARQRGGLFNVGIALAAAAAVPMTGHGASEGLVIRVAHIVHVLGGGLWIGTLAVMLFAAWTEWRIGTATLSTLLARFSPIALAGSGLMGASGVFLTYEHVGLSTALGATPYTRTLVFKVIVTTVIAVLGWRNWKLLSPAVSTPRARRQLVLAATAEVVLGVIVVLMAAAWLSSQAPPIS